MVALPARLTAGLSRNLVYDQGFYQSGDTLPGGVLVSGLPRPRA
jgi:hypothetical protein